MKHLTSSYSSSSSSSSPSSSSILSFGSKSATAGCLSAIMHRILCSGGLTTHSSDQITELDSMQRSNVQELKAKQNTEAAAAAAATSSTNSTPGNLVARLMGLDLNVEMPSEVKNSTSLSRSKSMNSVDYLGECKQLKGHKSSSSFHEVPTFHLLENENFLVLSFEGGRGESKEFKSKGRKNEKGHAELKQKQRERGELKKRNKREKVYEEKKKGNLSKRLCDIMSSVNVGNDGELENNANTSQKGYLDTDMVSFSQSLKCKEVPNGGKVKKRKKNRTTCYTEKKTETECSSEDSSPVSVFDFERQAPGTDVDSFGVGLGWRRKLSPELENDQHFILNSDSNLLVEEKIETENNNHERSKKKEKQRLEGLDLWGEICRLVEDELVGSHQIKAEMRKQSDLESISADFESEIFDHLLNELIDQLVGNPLKTMQLQNL